MKTRHKRSKRIYLLDGKRISSRDCLGFVHTASRDYKDVLGDEIKKGEKLVRFNNWNMGNEVLALESFVYDHDDGKGVILGVGYGKAQGRWRIFNAVTCKRFFISDFQEESG